MSSAVNLIVCGVSRAGLCVRSGCRGRQEGQARFEVLAAETSLMQSCSFEEFRLSKIIRLNEASLYLANITRPTSVMKDKVLGRSLHSSNYLG